MMSVKSSFNIVPVKNMAAMEDSHLKHKVRQNVRTREYTPIG